MDVYLQPLLDELKELWTSIEVMDKIKDLNRKISYIKGILMWILHDFT